MICYKVVKRFANNVLGSCCISEESSYFREYGTDIVAKDGLVFKNEWEAETFDWVNSAPRTSYEIWKCKCRNPRRIWYLCFRNDDAIIKKFWESKNRRRDWDKIGCCDATKGTYHAKNIQLIERNYKQIEGEQNNGKD